MNGSVDLMESEWVLAYMVGLMQGWMVEVWIDVDMCG